MPYALLATDDRLFAGLANGQLWESRYRGDSWTATRLQGDTLAVLALAPDRVSAPNSGTAIKPLTRKTRHALESRA